MIDGFDLNEVVKGSDGDSMPESQTLHKRHSVVLVLLPLIEFPADGGNN